MYALSSSYRRENATSDTVIQAWRSSGEAAPKPKGLIEHSGMTQTIVAEGLALAGMGRLNDVLGVFDSVVRVNPQAHSASSVGLGARDRPSGMGCGKDGPAVQGDTAGSGG